MLSVFQFDSQSVRVLIIDGEPWFVAKDVCEVLEISNVSDAVSRLDKDEKLVSAITISGQSREVLCINEKENQA